MKVKRSPSSIEGQSPKSGSLPGRRDAMRQIAGVGLFPLAPWLSACADDMDGGLISLSSGSSEGAGKSQAATSTSAKNTAATSTSEPTPASSAAKVGNHSSNTDPTSSSASSSFVDSRTSSSGSHSTSTTTTSSASQGADQSADQSVSSAASSETSSGQDSTSQDTASLSDHPNDSTSISESSAPDSMSTASESESESESEDSSDVSNNSTAASTSDSDTTLDSGSTLDSGDGAGSGTGSGSGDDSSSASTDTDTRPPLRWASGGTRAMLAKPFYPNPFKGAAVAPQCVWVGETTDGPCTTESDLVRQDVSEGWTGLPLRLALRVVDNNCQALAGVTVKIWHTNHEGVYSGMVPSLVKKSGDGSECLFGKAYETLNFFRGVQVTNDNGEVFFDTCFPGWYEDRAVHIHFQVKRGEQNYRVSQLFFPDEIVREIFDRHPEYLVHGQPDTFLDTDTIYPFIEKNLGAQAKTMIGNIQRLPDGAMLVANTIGIPVPS